MDYQGKITFKGKNVKDITNCKARRPSMQKEKNPPKQKNKKPHNNTCIINLKARTSKKKLLLKKS